MPPPAVAVIVRRSTAAAIDGSAAPVSLTQQTILVVDDDASARRLVARLLGDAGYPVIEAPTPHGALEIARERADAIGLLLTDVRMPRMTGLELARRFCVYSPSAGVLLMSGYHDHGDPPHPLLAKPFTPAELLAAVSSSIGAA